MSSVENIWKWNQRVFLILCWNCNTSLRKLSFLILIEMFRTESEFGRKVSLARQDCEIFLAKSAKRPFFYIFRW